MRKKRKIVTGLFTFVLMLMVQITFLSQQVCAKENILEIRQEDNPEPQNGYQIESGIPDVEEDTVVDTPDTENPDSGTENPDPDTESPFQYEIKEDGTIEIIWSWTYNMLGPNLTIPEEIDGKKVTSIQDGAFEKTSFESITIPSSVTSIGSWAFGMCRVDHIIVNDNNTRYDSRENCDAIIDSDTNQLIFGCHNTKIPSSVEGIGDYAFFASELESITIPSGVTSIGVAAFCECDGLESIKVEDGNKYYDSRDNCNAIIETASGRLIAGCKNTKIPSGVTGIGDSAFERCGGVKNITLPSGVTSIGNSAFALCYDLESVTLPSGVESIGSYAFVWGGLKSITIPASVKSIGDSAFQEHDDIVIYTEKDSYADKYANEHGYKVEYLGGNPSSGNDGNTSTDGNAGTEDNNPGIGGNPDKPGTNNGAGSNPDTLGEPTDNTEAPTEKPADNTEASTEKPADKTEASTEKPADKTEATTENPTVTTEAAAKENDKPTTFNIKDKKTCKQSKKVTVKDSDGIKQIKLNKKTIKVGGKKSYSFKLSKYKKYLKKKGKWNKLVVTDKNGKNKSIQFKTK